MELIFDEIFFERINFKPIAVRDKMADIHLKWDGSNIGPIDDNIYQCRKSEDDHILTLWYMNDKEEIKLIDVKVLKYKNEVPIIVDECKPIFGLKKVGKHKATLKGEMVILVRYKGDISLKKFFTMTLMKPSKMGKPFIDEIRKLFVFRWFMCLNNNFDNTVEVRTGSGINFPISCRENTFNYDPDDKATRIPNTVMKHWFEDDEFLVDDCILNFVKDKDVCMLRFEIQKVIMKFDKQLISWNNSIFEKLLYAQRKE